MPIMLFWFSATYMDLWEEQLVEGSSTVSAVLPTVGTVTEPQKSSTGVIPHTKPCKMGTYSSEEPAVVEP